MDASEIKFGSRILFLFSFCVRLSYDCIRYSRLNGGGGRNDTKRKTVLYTSWLGWGGEWNDNGIMHDGVIVRQPEVPFHLQSGLEKRHNLH